MRFGFASSRSWNNSVKNSIYNDKQNNSAIIAGAIFDFCGFLTTRPQSISVGSSEECSVIIKLIEEWAGKRRLSLNSADVKNWENKL